MKKAKRKGQKAQGSERRAKGKTLNHRFAQSWHGEEHEGVVCAKGVILLSFGCAVIGGHKSLYD